MNTLLFDVSKHVVIITGVSGQLGRQYAEAFLENDSVVVGIDVTRTLQVDDLEKKYLNFSYYNADVTSKANIENVLKDIIKHVGAPTVLINNAALDSPPSAPPEENGPFETYPEASWDKVMDVNLKGVFVCSQVFGSEMASRGYGSIINISSIYGKVSPDQRIYDYKRKRGEVFYKPIAYSVSKSGILNMTRYLAVYWAQAGVRVNSLVISGVYNGQDEDFLTAYCSRIPIGKMASISDFNGAVIFLASEASRYMTGSELVVDGGWTAI